MRGPKNPRNHEKHAQPTKREVTCGQSVSAVSGMTPKIDTLKKPSARNMKRANPRRGWPEQKKLLRAHGEGMFRVFLAPRETRARAAPRLITVVVPCNTS